VGETNFPAGAKTPSHTACSSLGKARADRQCLLRIWQNADERKGFCRMRCSDIIRSILLRAGYAKTLVWWLENRWWLNTRTNDASISRGFFTVVCFSLHTSSRYIRACLVAQPGGLQVGFSGARFNLKLKMEAVFGFLAY
jgi:hypothetical protein